MVAARMVSACHASILSSGYLKGPALLADAMRIYEPSLESRGGREPSLADP